MTYQGRASVVKKWKSVRKGGRRGRRRERREISDYMNILMR
jgi:hypothetical protein